MQRGNMKSKRMILELLHRPDGDLTKYRIVKETRANISWVIEFLRKLEKKKLIQGTTVKDVDGLITYYLSLDKKPKSYDFYLPEAPEYLKKVKWDYALTTYGAENIISHHLFLTRTDIYVREEELEQWQKELFKKGLIGRGNLRLLIPTDDYIFKFTQQLRGVNLVTMPLLMIDLKHEGGVCGQAYEYLVERYVSGHRN